MSNLFVTLRIISILFPCLFALGMGCNRSVNDDPSTTQMEIPSPDLPGAPKIPKLAVLRPYFETKLGNIDAGSAVATAFVAKVEGQPPVVLTVLSLLSQANGLSRDVVAGEQAEVVTGVTLGSAFGEIDSVIAADKVLATQPLNSGDILAISLLPESSDRFGTLPLATGLPAVGTKVWLSAALYFGASASQRQHVAEVTGVDSQGRLTYRFENTTISFQATAGAPMLNEQGQVVAMHVSGSLEGDTLVGYGNPTAAWLPILQAALMP